MRIKRNRDNFKSYSTVQVTMSGEGDQKVKKKRSRARKDPNEWEKKWLVNTIDDRKGVEETSSIYMDFLDRCRTERESVAYWVKVLRENGFLDLRDGSNDDPVPGTGFFLTNRDREILIGIVSETPLIDGANFVATHLDSPRIDLKPIPIDGDRDTGLGILRTHYYGGIKKYHWVNIPLSLHGRIVKEDGTYVDIGGEKDEPIFVIPDLLPHLSRKAQNERKLSDGIRGEEMLALCGLSSIPEEEDRPPIIDEVLEHLRSRYGIVEEDLISSDLSLVPSQGSRDIGLDRGLIGSYGHDNRVSAFCASRSLLLMVKEGVVPRRWSIALNFDKEEIGSDGNTGAKSQFLELALYGLLDWSGLRGNRRELLRTCSGSFCISADVKSALNPTFKGVQDIRNSARLGAGITITKYTGRGGKSGANDASAEMVGGLRRLYNQEGINWVMQETGKVDAGGGGTVAKFMASRNMDVVDNGLPLLSMHSPFEILAKVELYMGLKAFRSFYTKYPLE